MSIFPPPQRIWWNEPVEKIEVLWVVIALVWSLIMFFMMPYWHLTGEQNLSNEAYRISPDTFAEKAEAVAAKYTVRTETSQDVPVVHPPAGSDVYMIARLWECLTSAPYDPGQALIKLSLSHPGRRKEECRRRSREELAKLAPNMRAPLVCSRERWPVLVELDLNGKSIFARTVNPAGLSADGQSSFYSTFAVPAGRHRIAVRMRDRGDGQGFDYTHDAWITIAPAQALVVGFVEDERNFFIE